MLNPTIDSGMINAQPAFSHNLFQVTIAEGVSQVPTDTQQDDFGLIVPPLKQIAFTHEQGSGC